MTNLELLTITVMTGLVISSASCLGRGLDAARGLGARGKAACAARSGALAALPVADAEAMVALHYQRIALPIIEQLARNAQVIQGAGYSFTLLSLVIGYWSADADLATAVSVALLSTLVATPCAIALMWLRSRIEEQLDQAIVEATLTLFAGAPAPATAQGTQAPAPFGDPREDGP